MSQSLTDSLPDSLRNRVVLTIDEVGLIVPYLGNRKLRGMIKSGEIPAINLGIGDERPRWGIRRDDLEAWIGRRMSKPKPKPMRKPKRQRRATATGKFIK